MYETKQAFTKLKKGKEVLKFQGYEYVLFDNKTLIPQGGIIAKLEDYTVINEKTKRYSNKNMNTYPAYCEAMEYLYNISIKVKKNGV